MRKYKCPECGYEGHRVEFSETPPCPTGKRHNIVDRSNLLDGDSVLYECTNCGMVGGSFEKSDVYWKLKGLGVDVNWKEPQFSMVRKLLWYSKPTEEKVYDKLTGQAPDQLHRK